MDYDLSKPQKLLQQSVRSFIDREYPLARVREFIETETTWDSNLWQGIAEQGWIGMHLPEEFGGLGLSVVDLAIVAEEMGHGCLPGPFLSTTWAADLLANSGNAEICQRYIPKITEGELKATVATLGTEGSWDEAATGLVASEASDGLRLNGTKTMVLDAHPADLIVCVARMGSELVLAVAASAANGLQIHSTPGIDPTRGLCEIRFEDVAIPSDQIVTVGNPAQRAVKRANQIAATLASAELLGAMQWMLDTSVEYAKTRKQFDKPIGAFQAVQHQCADMLSMTESSRSATYYAAWALAENDVAADTAVSIAKAFCSDSGREVGNRAVQVHGGIGFTWEHDLHFFYKRVKALEYLLGDATCHRERLAKLVIDE